MPCSSLQTHDEVENEVRVFAVEIAGGFIGEQHGRVIGEAARDGDALPFAAGKLGGKMIEADARGRRDSSNSIGALFAIRRRGRVRFEHRDLHVFHRGESREADETPGK